MSRKAAPKPATNTAAPEVIDLASALSESRSFKHFRAWLIGDTPLITHAWSEKAKKEMLAKQVGATRSAKEKRDPQQDFIDSLYDLGDGRYGFPVTAIKNAILSSAHKKKGIARTDVLSALWLDAEMVRVRPALAGAICDLPMISIFGGRPEMREDMVRVGAGLNKTANLAFRAQFWPWAMPISGKFIEAALKDSQLAFLLREAGMAIGLGDWRNEKRGVFGAFHMGDHEEQMAWELFAAGKGPLPEPYQQFAEAAE